MHDCGMRALIISFVVCFLRILLGSENLKVLLEQSGRHWIEEEIGV